MIRLIRFFKHYNNVYSSMLNKIKVKLLEYGYKAEHDSFYVIFYIGIIPVTTGIISMLTLILKGFFTVIMLIYRYIIVFFKEVERIWTAYQMRAPKQNGVNFKAWGSMIGSLMIRSIDKAQMVYESMELRGFNPETFFVKTQKITKRDALYLIIGMVLLVTIRWIPIFDLVGNLFV